MELRLLPLILTALMLVHLAVLRPAVAQTSVDQAISLWLSGDDASAFPALAALAEAGDERAMLFLGAVEPQSSGSPFLRSLDRATRNRLLRAPGGLSGQSWLHQVTVEKDIAAALLGARNGDPAPLLALGETSAATDAILMSFNASPWSLVSLDRSSRLPETLRHLVWIGADLGLSPDVSGARVSPSDKAAFAAALAEATAPHWQNSLQLALFHSSYLPNSRQPPPAALDRLTGLVLRLGEFSVRTHPDFVEADTDLQDAAILRARGVLSMASEAAPVRHLCERTCPDDPIACTSTIWSLTSGGMAVGAFHTPLDSLVPQATYLASPRFLVDLREAAVPAPSGANACAVTLLMGD
jgi:hypothetical protein